MLENKSDRKHQEIILGESKFIIYMNQPTQHPHKPKMPTLSSLKKRKLFSKTSELNNRTKRICELAKENFKKGKQNKQPKKRMSKNVTLTENKQNNQSIRIKILPEKQKKQQLTDCNAEKSKKSIGDKKNHSKITSNSSLLPIESISKRRSSISATPQQYKQRRSCFGKIQVEEKTLQSKNKNPKYLNHMEIKSLFGPHHQLYTPQIDYLVKYKGRNAKNEYASLVEKEEKIASELISLKSEELRQKRLNIKNGLGESHYYQFNIERADIVKYLNHLNSEGKWLYPILIQRKCENEKYIDEEFHSDNIKKINKEKVFWHRLQPHPKIQLFPDNFAENLIKPPNKGKILPIVNFLNCLSILQPQIFMRLFQPVFHNVYSIWLYLKGKYEPIYVDGDIPFDQQMNPLYGYVEGKPWYSILIKCLAKVLGSYSMEILERISPCKLYEFFTGIEPKTMRIDEIQNSDAFFDFINKNNSQMTPILMFHDRAEIILEASKDKSILKLSNPNSKIHKNIRAEEVLLERGEVMLLNHSYNWFIYSLDFLSGEMTKFDLSSSRKSEMIFRTTSFSDEEYSSWVYVYEVSFCKNKKEKILNLKHELQIKGSQKVSLKRGNYIFFLEVGKKKIGEFFSQASKSVDREEKSKKKKEKNYCLTLFSSQEIKLSKGIELGKSFYGKYVEDSQSLYCASGRKEANLD